MKRLRISKPDRNLSAEIPLEGSKSLSNRALILLTLAGGSTSLLSNLSPSEDTQRLLQLLQHPGPVYDAGDGGTTFRFLAAFLALKPGEKILTGSQRMKERPVGPLVEALRSIGAKVDYLEKEGFPPLRIGESQPITSKVVVPADVSSQFLSALLLIAPYWPGGLELQPEGRIVSRPYVDMTLKVLTDFGALVERFPDRIFVGEGGCEARQYGIESDWSAAAYWYVMAAFSDKADLLLKGLHAESPQGDAILATLMQRFGVETHFEPEGARLIKTGHHPPPFFEYDFSDCPDLAQPLALACAGLGVMGLFSGLETLRIKETDRIAALKNELGKIGTLFMQLPPRFSKKAAEKTYFNLENKADLSNLPAFDTYGDHRMAMSFATLGMLGPVEIENPEVVSKSYPSFWEHLRIAGFKC